MATAPSDAVDRGILYLLQKDARRPVTEIADRLGVADNTVHNRIDRLESDGVITGYSADVDYDRAGVEHYYLFVCTARVSERERLATEVRKLPGVVEVVTLMTGTNNVHVFAAHTTKADITDLAISIDGQGLVIERENLVWQHTRQPLSAFRLDDGVPARRT